VIPSRLDPVPPADALKHQPVMLSTSGFLGYKLLGRDRNKLMKPKASDVFQVQTEGPSKWLALNSNWVDQKAHVVL